MPFSVHLFVVCPETPCHPGTALITRLTVANPAYLRAAKSALRDRY